MLVSWAPGTVNEKEELSLTPPNFGVYLYDAEARTNQLVADYEDSWELYAHAVAERSEPPVIDSVNAVEDPPAPATFGSVDVKLTSLFSKHGNVVSGAQFDGTPLDDALAHARKVRIVEGFSSEATDVTMFGLTMAEGAALLGEADVEADGSWLAEIPPYLPVHLQPIDEYELAIRNQTTWIQGMPGEARVCGGCHESRTDANVPGGQQLSIAAARGAQKLDRPIAERVEYPWHGATDASNPNEIQKLFDAKCTSCHNETTNGSGPQEFYEITMTDELSGEQTVYRIPRLDLTSRAITVTYDDMTEAWPASYVSLFYPAALEMEMGMGVEVKGTIPPKWAVPSDARNSALVEKLNITSSIDADRTAWRLGEPFGDPGIRGGTRTLHPDDVGVALGRDERRMLIRAIDMGGQYYARQNTNVALYADDPVAGDGYQK
jgi:hypothetical protein